MVNHHIKTGQVSAPPVPDAPPHATRPPIGPNAIDRWLRPLYSLDRAVAAACRISGLGARSLHLRGNYAPVTREVHERDLPVIGTLPDSLDGLFAQVGPNPMFAPMGGYHWFDGDGMVSSVRIREGRASYSNRYVQTSRLKQERRAGWPVFVKMGDLTSLLSSSAALMMASLKHLLHVAQLQDGHGTANTSLVFHAGRLLALHENDMPYHLRALCSGVVETLGRVRGGMGDGALSRAVAAHPKIDPRTGELVMFSYSLHRRPHATVGYADVAGRVTRSVPIHSLPQPVLMHDIAITEDYVVLIDPPLVCSMSNMVLGGPPLRFDKARGTRLGLLRRNADDDSAMQWFEVPGCMVLHTANAWQEGEKIVKLYAAAYEEFTFNLSEQHERAVFCDAHVPYMYEFVMDLADGTASMRRVAQTGVEFPMVPANSIGNHSRYAYCATLEPTDLGGVAGISKIDLTAQDMSTAVAGQIYHGKGRYGGEAQFVPAVGNGCSSARGEEGDQEDAGYLLTYVYDSSTNCSELVVYNAATMDSKPAAVVQLPQRVPFGFHTLHMSEQQLGQQTH